MAATAKGDPVAAVASEDELAAFLLTDAPAPHALFFFAPWDAPSAPGGVVDAAFRRLAALHPGVRAGAVDADAAPGVAEQCAVSAVPTVIFFGAGGREGERLEGADAAELTRRFERRAAAAASGVPVPAGAAAGGGGGAAAARDPPPALAALRARVVALTLAAPVMAFIKGTPDAPKCKFSRRLVELLRAARAPFGAFDVLSDAAVKAGLKDVSNWPTYPQLFVNGALVGGVDIVQELADTGELAAVLPPVAEASGAGAGAGAGASGGAAPSASAPSASASAPAPAAPAADAVAAAVSAAPAVLLMKGTPSDPACGFSERAAGALAAGGVPFTAVDVLADPGLREGSKAAFAFRTFPTLFVGGAHVGGVDAIDAAAAAVALSGRSLADELGVTAAAAAFAAAGGGARAAAFPPDAALEGTRDALARVVASRPVVLFMKGTPAAPRCGFSARTLEALQRAGLPTAGPAAARAFRAVDVLASPAVREGVKAFSAWPTIPQLFVRGEFVGGADIVGEMAEAGELAALLRPALDDAAGGGGGGAGHVHSDACGHAHA